jgi:protoporphyrinogen oxidase
MRVAVLGAGPAGLAAAYELVASGVAVDVYEAAPQVGGLAQSFDLWGRRVDLGSHIFAEGLPHADALFRAAVGSDAHRVRLLRTVRVDGRTYRYPFRPVDLARRAPGPLLLRAAPQFFAARVRRRDAARAEDARAYVTARLGRSLAETFFRGYVEKLYGRPWEQIDAALARGLLDAAPSAVRRTSFPYPTRGTGAICEGLARGITGGGGSIRTSSPVRSLTFDDGVGVDVDANGPIAKYDRVLSTLPLAVLARCVPAAPADLRATAARAVARSTVLVYLDVRGGPGFAPLWCYLYDRRYRIGRVANLARWWPAASTDPAPRDRTILCAELWCDVDDDTWTATEGALAEVCASELRDAGLLEPGASVADVHVRRVAGTHPVPSLDARELTIARRAYFAGQPALTLAGRHALAPMSDVADNLEAGALAAHEIASDDNW